MSALHKPAQLPSYFVRLPLASVLMGPAPEMRFVLPGLQFGTVGALIGSGGSSKTTLALQIAVAQALAIPTAAGLFTAPETPRRVAFVTGEETALTCAVRLHAILQHLTTEHLSVFGGASRDDIVRQLDHRLSVYPCAGKDLCLVQSGKRTKRLRDLEECIRGSDLVFIETVSRLHDGDENTTHGMVALVSAVESIAQSVGCAVVMIHHASKLARHDSQHAARGSSAFVDNCRWIANLFPMTDEEAKEESLDPVQRKRFVRFEVTKANYIPALEPCWLRRLDGGLLTFAKFARQRSGRRHRNVD